MALALAAFIAIPTTGSAQITPVVGVSKHIGFHQYAVGTPSQMQAWWNSSPYFDVGFYANGASNHTKNDLNLNAEWVTTVQDYGWGLVPIWVGEQAPCSSYSKTFDWDPNKASAEGAYEAGMANASLGPALDPPLVGGLGLQGTVVYYDFEPYDSTAWDPTDTYQCGPAVTAFLTGWVSGLHGAQYKAGAYGIASDAASDFVGASPALDGVWIASASLSYDQATVWGISRLADSTMPNSTRLRQYTVDSQTAPCCDETWGTITFHIDKDIEDGQVVTGNGTKSYTFTEQTPFPAADSTAQETIPEGISGVSDIANGGQFPVGKKGNVVGFYVDDLGYSHGFTYDPNSNYFFYPAIDCAGATGTQLFGVNSAGLAVGTFYDSSNTEQAFTFDTSAPGSSCIKLPCTDCSAEGINDAGWIVGNLNISGGSSGVEGFVYKNGGFITASFGNSTNFRAINGQGLITGWYQSTDFTQNYLFIADASQSPISLIRTPFQCVSTYDNANGINNNGQVVGAGPTGFLYSGGQCQVVGGDGSGPNDGWTNGLNDYAQIVGETFARPNLGFLLLPQN